MADKEPTKLEKEETTTEKKTVTEKVTPHQAAVAPVSKGVGVLDRRHTKKWVIGIVAAVVVIYILAIVIGLTILHATDSGQRGFTRTGTTQQFGGRPRAAIDRNYTVQQSDSDGLTTTTTNTTYTQTQGVVTAVASDSITVAGGGKTQVIKTNSSTTYTDDVKPAVNDTVVVVGTKSGDTITATQIEAIRYDN